MNIFNDNCHIEINIFEEFWNFQLIYIKKIYLITIFILKWIFLNRIQINFKFDFFFQKFCFFNLNDFQSSLNDYLNNINRKLIESKILF